MPYEAFYVPSVPRERLEAAVTAGVRWLVRRPFRGVYPAIVVGYKLSVEGMLSAKLAPESVGIATPHSMAHLPRATLRILAVWPQPEILELAERLAEGSKLAVIGRTDVDLVDWVERAVPDALPGYRT